MIYVQPIHLTWTPAVGNVFFHRWLAQQYVAEVKRAIDEEIYRDKWRRLSPRYKAWKQKNHLSPKIWESTGELRNRLTVRLGLVVTFSGFTKHRGTNLTCTQLARMLEYGTSKIPPRPLFRSVYYEMNRNINKWYQLYLEENNEL